MKVKVYMKDGYTLNWDNVTEILNIDYYSEPEIWINHYVNQTSRRLTRTILSKQDIEIIKIRME